MQPHHISAAAMAVSALVASAPALAKPESASLASERGPLCIGTQKLTAVLDDGAGGQVTKTIQVFYPSHPIADGTCGAPTPYTISGAGGGTFQVSSPLGAVEGAVPLPGPFPLYVFDHGGGLAGGDSQRVSQLPVLETLASHGFVAATALHPADPMLRVRDLPLVIRYMKEGSPLVASIDPDRVGLGGWSSGGGAVLGVVAGIASAGIEPNVPGVQAMVVYEPNITMLSADDRDAIRVPYILFNGSQLKGLDGSLQAPRYEAIFASSGGALPRYHVFSDGAIHYNFFSNLCPTIDQAREQAIAALGPGVEPLAGPISPPNAAAAYALAQWTIGATQTEGFGGGRNVCNELGFVSSFCAGGACDSKVPAPAIPYEAMVPVVVHYTVAFLRVHLGGENDQHAALAPGQAKQVGPAEITIIEE